MNSEARYLVILPDDPLLSRYNGTSIVLPDSSGSLIHFIGTEAPTGNTYWTDWGGSYNIIEDRFVFPYFDKYLRKVESLAELVGFQGSYYRGTTGIYIHTEYFPWHYVDSSYRISKAQGFSSAVPNPLKPSDDKVSMVHFPTRLHIPSFSYTLSDPMHGINLHNSFKINLNNEDGYFDLKDYSNVLNAPLYVYKSVEENPNGIGHYKIIRLSETGEADIQPSVLSLGSVDTLRWMETEVTKTVKELGFNIPDKNGEFLPIAYGSPKKVALIKVKETDLGGEMKLIDYLVVDPNYLLSVNRVYNESGHDFTFSFAEGMISVEVSTAEGAPEEPKYTDISGFTPSLGGSTVGGAIVDIITKVSGYPLVDGFWDEEEVRGFLSSSYPIDIVFKKGKVRDFVARALKSEMAFLIQNPTGSLTLRRWGGEYGRHIFPSWIITQPPTITFQELRNYISSCTVRYDKRGEEYEGSIINRDREEEIGFKWNYKVHSSFDTDLSLEPDAEELSEKLLDRFGQRAKIVKLSLGEDLSGVKLLDLVIIPIAFNKRLMATQLAWVVTAVSPAQDTLTLEPAPEDIVISHSIPLHHPSIQYQSGYLNQPFINYADGYLNQNTLTEGE